MPRSALAKKLKLGPYDLSQAVWNHDVELVRHLLEKGADPDHIPGGRTHLSGQTPLSLAIDLADFEISDANKLLHEAAVELSTKLAHEDSQVARRSLIQIIQLLISSGANLNKLSPSRSPLNWAADRGDAEIVKLLLDAGADPAGICHSIASELSRRVGRSFVEGFYGTALHVAAAKGHLKVVQMLISSGADANCLDHQDKTPAQVADAKGHHILADYLRNVTKTKNA